MTDGQPCPTCEVVDTDPTPPHGISRVISIDADERAELARIDRAEAVLRLAGLGLA